MFLKRALICHLIFIPLVLLQLIQIYLTVTGDPKDQAYFPSTLAQIVKVNGNFGFFTRRISANYDGSLYSIKFGDPLCYFMVPAGYLLRVENLLGFTKNRFDALEKSKPHLTTFLFSAPSTPCDNPLISFTNIFNKNTNPISLEWQSR